MTFSLRSPSGFAASSTESDVIMSAASCGSIFAAVIPCAMRFDASTLIIVSAASSMRMRCLKRNHVAWLGATMPCSER